MQASTIIGIELGIIFFAVGCYCIYRKNNRKLKYNPTINTVPGALFDFSVIAALFFPEIAVCASHPDSIIATIFLAVFLAFLLIASVMEIRHILRAYAINSSKRGR